MPSRFLPHFYLWITPHQLLSGECRGSRLPGRFAGKGISCSPEPEADTLPSAIASQRAAAVRLAQHRERLELDWREHGGTCRLRKMRASDFELLDDRKEMATERARRSSLTTTRASPGRSRPARSQSDGSVGQPSAVLSA